MKNVCISTRELRQEISIIQRHFQNFIMDSSDGKAFRSLHLLVTDNSMECICLYCFLVTQKKPVMLIDENISPEQLQSMIQKYRPAMLLYPEGEKGGAFFGFTWKSQYGHYGIGMEERESVWKERSVHPELAVLLSTSGSTGSSKFVMLTYDNLEANADSIIESLELKEGDRAAVMLPISYSYGLSVVNSYLKVGGTLLIPEGILVQKTYWDFLESQQVNSICGVPYTYEIIKKLRILERPFKQLKLMTQAGGALDAMTKQFFLEKLKGREQQGQNVDFAVMYGQTEATARMSCFFLNRQPDRLCSVGKAIPGGRFTIENRDGEGKGEVVYCGKNVFLGYALSWKDLTDDRKCQGNSLHTGDIGWLDEEGYLYLSGRKSRFVKIRGYRISLDELQLKITEGLGREAVCINGQGQNMDKIYAVLTGEDARCVSGGETARVTDIVGDAHLGQKDYSLVIMDEIPRKRNGKADYRKIQRMIHESESGDKKFIDQEPDGIL